MSYRESTSSYQSSFGGSNTAGAFGENLANIAPGSYSSYETTSTTGYGEANDATSFLVGGAGTTSNEYYSSSSQGGYASGAQARGSDLEASFEQQSLSGGIITGDANYSSSNVEQQIASSTTYATDSQGLYQDPNPQVLRRPAPGGTQTYTQRVLVRFLQPPPISPPGPLIIKEVRPPQPPPPPPLYIRQRPPPPPTLPPLVIREAPPKMPPPVGTQVITKMLPALPVPPRSVIIERLPPLPPRPRDVIVERWLPYRTQQKRRVIIQRAPPPVIQKPRNIIINYEPPKAQIVRRFQNLGVERVNPSEYIARYGAQLEDAQTLVQQARQAGVVEDLSPPAGSVSNIQSSSYESYQSGGVGVGNASYDAVSSSASGYDLGGTSLNLTGNTGRVSSNGFESSSWHNTRNGSNRSHAGGLESPFSGLSLVGNANHTADSSSNYQFYSS